MAGMGDSVATALRQELVTTKNSLTEVLDEVVYFEQQCARANERADGVAQLLRAGQAAHRDALDAVLDFANARGGQGRGAASVADAAAAHSRAQGELQRVSELTRQCDATLSALGVSGGGQGWSLAGRHPDAVLAPPSSSNDALTFGASPTRQHQKQDAPGSAYANIRINELVALLGAERNTVAALREEMALLATPSSSTSDAAAIPLPPSSASKTFTPYASANRDSAGSASSVRVSRRGSVEIQVRGDQQFGGDEGETVQALRERVRELERELSEERVKANGSERDRASASRDRDAALMDLERAERDRESAVQAVKSSDLEADAARDKSRRLERDCDIARRGKVAAENQLSEALVERDRAKGDSERAAKLLEQARASEGEALRQRDEAIDRAEQERVRAEEMSAERERVLFREDELKRTLAVEVHAKEEETARANSACHERDSARQERDSLKVDVESLRKRLETSERERAFSLGDAHEAQRQRDAAQAQVVEAVEESERREKQRRAALVRAQQAEDAAAAAQRARKEAEDACRALDSAESSARVEAEAERRQRQALVDQMKTLMNERDAAVNNVGKDGVMLKAVTEERDRAQASEKTLQRRSEELERLLSEEGAAMAAAQEKLRELVDRAADAQALKNEQSLLAEQLSTLQTENQRLRQEMDDRTRAMREASYQQMAALQNDNEAAAAAFAATGREKDDALRSQEAEMANMRATIRALERDLGSSVSSSTHATRALEEKHAASVREVGELRHQLAQSAAALDDMKHKANNLRDSMGPDLRRALDAVADRDATISSLKQTLTTERRARLQDSMRVQQQQQLQMTPQARVPLGATPSSSVPRARVRIHRSGSIVIKNVESLSDGGEAVGGATPMAVSGDGGGTTSRMSSPGSSEEVVQLRVEVSLLQEEKKKLESDNQSLKARLSLQESFAATSAAVAAGSPARRSPGAVQVNRLQGELRRLQDEARHTSQQARGQVETLEEAVRGLEITLEDQTRESDNLREELRRLQSRQNNGDRETIRMLRAQLEHTQLAQKQAQQQLQNAVQQTEQASKGTRAARNREAKLERELNKSKEREAELGQTIEKLSKQNAQLEIQVHTLNQRARQARQALSELQSSSAAELDRARSEAKQLKLRLSELTADSEHRNAGMVKRTEEIANALRRDLEQHQALLQTERDARRDSEEKVLALENERQQLAKDMQEAARHLRLVALQKSQVSQELEQVHSAIADLEEQLVQARTDNDRLRKVSAHVEALSVSPNAALSAESSSRSNGPGGGTSVHVSRRGSINISRKGARGDVSKAGNIKKGSRGSASSESTAISNSSSRSSGNASSVPLPQSSSATRNIRVKAHRSGSVEINRGGQGESSDLVSGQEDPWTLGSDSAVSSIRRGTYFGTYTQAQANTKRERHRTRSTVDRRFLTPGGHSSGK